MCQYINKDNEITLKTLAVIELNSIHTDQHLKDVVIQILDKYNIQLSIFTQ